MDKQPADSAVRRQLVAELSAEKGRTLTAGQLAELAGVHTSTARSHLDQLVAAQTLGTAYERRGVGRPRKVYFVPDRSAHGSLERENQSFALLSGLLVAMLSPSEDTPPRTPEQAGEHWALEHVDIKVGVDPATTPGQWLGKVAGLTDVLHDWGYEPQISTGADRDKADLRLSHCPFRDLARANPAVVCGIHLGLIRGAMTKVGEHSTDVELLPFAEGDTCLAHLHRRSGSSAHPLPRDKGVSR